MLAYSVKHIKYNNIDIKYKHINRIYKFIMLSLTRPCRCHTFTVAKLPTRFVSLNPKKLQSE